MECYAVKNGTAMRLPVCTEWEFEYAAFGAADAFSVKCAFDKETAAALDGAARFYAEDGGKRVFTGVIDEVIAEAKGTGCTISVTGRGMAALLMDNESMPRSYARCGTADILANHVAPYGIGCGRIDTMGVLDGYTVESGASEWKALADFTRWAGDIYPRFTPEGKLMLTKSADGTVTVTDRCGVGAVRYEMRRYGVVSEVVVRTRSGGAGVTVKNGAFAASGGAARRIVTVPNRTGYDKRRFTAEYVIENSERESRVLTLTLGQPFAAFAGDTAAVKLDSMGISGTFTVSEAVSWADSRGCGTAVTLIPKRGE